MYDRYQSFIMGMTFIVIIFLPHCVENVQYFAGMELKYLKSSGFFSLLCQLHGTYIFIGREAREIMHLVASVRPSVCLRSHA